MRGSRLVLPLAALGVLAIATPARAQNYCYGGQLWTCFSYQLNVTALNGGGSAVSLWVRNNSTAAPGGQASWITALGIYSPPAASTAYGLAVGTTGSVTTVGAAGSQWKLSTPPPTLGLPGSLVLAATGANPAQGDISGCGTEGGATIYFKTCAPNTGWVVFDFKTTTTWSGTFDLGVKFQTSQGSFECTTGAPSRSTGPCTTTTVTPEPVTMALLGTGLAGMGLARLRRRKKNGDIESA